MRQRRPHGDQPLRTASPISRPPSGSAVTAPAWRSRASCSSAATTRSESSARTPWRHPQTNGRVAQPRAARQAAVLSRPTVRRPVSVRMFWPLDPGFGCAMWQRAPASRPAHPTTNFTTKQIVRARQARFALMRRGRLPEPRCRHVRVDGLDRLSGRNASPSGIHPINILSPIPEPTRGSRTEVSMGARAQTIRPAQRSHAPPDTTT